MGKLDKILSSSGANIDASMGAGRAPRPLHGTTPASTTPTSPRLQGLVRSKDAAEIPVDRIDRDPSQPREDFDEESLTRLAESMSTRGQLQPIRVRWDDAASKYIVVCGERRWRAARLAGLPTLSCVVMDRAVSQGELLALQLVENALREDLRPVEQARAYRSLMDLHGWSGNQLAKELAIHQTSVVRALALLELPEPVQAQVEQGALAASVAYEVSKLEEPALQTELAEAAVTEKLTRAEVAEAIKAVKARRPASAAKAKPQPVEFDLGEGVTVTVRYRRPSTQTAVQALRRALKLAQEAERDRDGQAA